MTLKDHILETLKTWQDDGSRIEALAQNLEWMIMSRYLGEWKVFDPENPSCPSFQYLIVKLKTDDDFYSSSVRVAVFYPNRNEFTQVFSLNQPSTFKVEEVSHYRAFGDEFFYTPKIEQEPPADE